jgi:hypothetical protein
MSNFTTTYIGKYAVSLSNHNIYRKINIKKIFKNTPVPRFNQEHTEKLLNSSLASLTYLSQGSSTNLFSARTVFPFVLFADTLNIDKQKLTVVHNDFLKSSHTTSIRLKDLRNVETVLGPFFGSIILTSQHFLNNTQTLNFLKRKDAIYAQRLLQGFMVAHDSSIDTDDIEDTKLLELLIKIGRENLK